MDQMMQVVKETATQTRPHASVIGWSTWNEGGSGEFSWQLASTIRRLDPTERKITISNGGGDFDVHTYPNLNPWISHRAVFWTGIDYPFVSEVGAYGLPSLGEMKAIVGDDLFAFDSAEYYWDSFNDYRYNDGPVFREGPVVSGDWPTEKIREYVLNHVEPSERWLVQYMKYMYEHFRGQRFEPTACAIHCRFDDALPMAFLGNVSFNGVPRKAYFATKEACQQVLPIVRFGYTGVDDIRVINEYWFKNWKGCTLKYVIKTYDGKMVSQGHKKFDLPADSVVKVISAKEIGDIYHQPGFKAELIVLDNKGKVLSKNRYDLTKDEIDNFVTCVYPLPPVKPVDSVMVSAVDAMEARGVVQRIDCKDSYCAKLLELDGEDQRPCLKYAVKLPKGGEYLIRVACSSGEVLRAFELFADGQKRDLEEYPGTAMTSPMCRFPYSDHRLSWYPGWRVHLSKGAHILEFRWPDGRPAPKWAVDAICLQYSRDSYVAGK